MGATNKVELQVTVGNSLGIHARPASMLVQLASKFNSVITVKNESDEVDGKSLMGLLMLAAGKGSRLILIFEGEDAEQARDAFYDLIVIRQFDEE
jgi:phosphocarrier protein